MTPALWTCRFSNPTRVFCFVNTKIRNKYSQKRNCMATVPIYTFMCPWAIYLFPRSICIFCCRKYVDRSWEYINRSQTHEWNVENGTASAQLPKKEYINRIFVAVYDILTSWLAWPWPLRPWGHNHSCGTPNKKKLSSTDTRAKITSKSPISFMNFFYTYTGTPFKSNPFEIRNSYGHMKLREANNQAQWA